MWFHLCAFDQGRTRHNRYAVNATERRMTFVSFFPGAALGKVLAWSKAVSLSQVGVFFSSNFFAAETCKLLWHWKANWAKDGSTGGLVATVGAGSGPQDQAHSDTHHAAGTLSSLFEPLLCSAFFFPFPSISSILNGWAQGRLWKSPPGAVVWPKPTDLVPAIADLVDPFSASAAVAPFAGCGLQYHECWLEATQMWNWTNGTGVTGDFHYWLNCERVVFNSRQFFLKKKKTEQPTVF